MPQARTETAIIALVKFDVTELTPYYKNPRRGDVNKIARSLDVNSQYRPIVVNLGTHTGRPLEVLAGNHTLAAAKQLGWASIDATTVDVDDLAAARIVAADNRTADLGSYDDEQLIELLEMLAEGDEGLEGTGYTDDDLAALLNADVDEEPNDSGAIDDYSERFELVVECRDETAQAKLFEQLSREGWTCRLLTL